MILSYDVAYMQFSSKPWHYNQTHSGHGNYPPHNLIGRVSPHCLTDLLIPDLLSVKEMFTSVINANTFINLQPYDNQLTSKSYF